MLHLLLLLKAGIIGRRLLYLASHLLTLCWKTCLPHNLPTTHAHISIVWLCLWHAPCFHTTLLLHYVCCIWLLRRGLMWLLLLLVWVAEHHVRHLLLWNPWLLQIKRLKQWNCDNVWLSNKLVPLLCFSKRVIFEVQKPTNVSFFCFRQSSLANLLGKEVYFSKFKRSWFVIGGFWSILCAYLFEGLLLVIVIRIGGSEKWLWRWLLNFRVFEKPSKVLGKRTVMNKFV